MLTNPYFTTYVVYTKVNVVIDQIVHKFSGKLEEKLCKL
jgi:hypothetical protein